MPKLQKSEIADNQQGQALAYILGVYFGDGCITGKKRKHFHLKTIDEDFADVVSKAFKVLGYESKRSVQKQHPTSYGKKLLNYVDVYSDDFCQMVEQITHKKTLIPTAVYESKQNKMVFLSGFLDSDGWVNINADKSGSTIRLQLGVAKTGEYIYDIKRLFDDLGIKCQKIQTRTLPSGKVYKRIRMNPQSFLESGLWFNIRRKQERLDMYRKAVDTLGKQRVRASFNDYKRDLLEMAGKG